jgi:ppGpp synthetase/RelA/SpoT-type nucleotidyltranferase
LESTSPVGWRTVLLPASREQINKLGKRLASDQPASEDDLNLLEELVVRHALALELARPRVNNLASDLGTAPLHITHRAKTTQTIIEKLCREHGMALARVQDLAGIRIVGAIRFDEQDRLAAEIVHRFPPDPRDAKIVDRRTDPSHGYRALHVIVCLDGISIEVQVRTILQHVWADLMERLADRLGRQIRYGEPPVPPPGMSLGTAQSIIQAMMGISDEWAAPGAPAVSDAPFAARPAGAEPLTVDRLTEEVWRSVANALREGGVDL